MENKSGFKECSRCGLRNKPTAKQCDFCGQKFDVVDEWELQVDALEKLSRESKRVEVTEDTSKKIEATIVRREPVEKAPEPPVVVPEVKEKVPERPPEPQKVSEPEPPTSTITFTATESKPVEVEDVPVVEEPPEVVIESPVIEDKAPVIEPGPEPVVTAEVAPAEKPKPRKAPKRKALKRRPAADGRLFKRNLDLKDRKSVVFLVVLVIGVLVYLSSILMSASIGTVGAWSLVTLSGLMVVAGISQLVIEWGPSHAEHFLDYSEIVEICPTCNEHVHSDDERCPACGTDFDPSDEM